MREVTASLLPFLAGAADQLDELMADVDDATRADLWSVSR
jgi:hypothetical protein